MDDYLEKILTPREAMAHGQEVCIGVSGVCFRISMIRDVTGPTSFIDECGKEWFGMTCWKKKTNRAIDGQ